MVRIGNWKSLNDDAMAKDNQSHKQKIQRPHQRPLLALMGRRVGLELPLAKRSAEKRVQRVLEALAISTGTAKTKASCKLAFG